MIIRIYICVVFITQNNIPVLNYVGICDCCDGSDENLYSRIKCPDSCNNDMSSFRKLALQQYRTLQAGIQVFLFDDDYDNNKIL